MCILMYLPTSWTDLTISFVISYPVLFSLPHFLFPFHHDLHNMMCIWSKKKKKKKTPIFHSSSYSQFVNFRIIQCRLPQLLLHIHVTYPRIYTYVTDLYVLVVGKLYHRTPAWLYKEFQFWILIHNLLLTHLNFTDKRTWSEIHRVSHNYLHGAESTVAQLLNKFSVFCGTRRYITVLTNTHHLTLSWGRKIQAVPSHQERSSLQVSRTKFWMNFGYLQCMPHAPPISPSLVWSS
jgi:hypothetical protein